MQSLVLTVLWPFAYIDSLDLMNAYLQAIAPYWLPGLLAFGLTFLGVVIALWLFPKIGLLDKPQKYGLARAPIPYSGGLILFAVFIALVLVFLPLEKHLIGVLVAASMIVLVSFLDDRYGLSPFLRLGVQILAAFTVVLSGIGIAAVSNPLGGTIPLDTWQIPFQLGETLYQFTVWADLFTMLWIVAMINTMNWLDGIPGLASGISTIGAGVMFLLAIRPNFHYIDQTEAAILAVIVAGSAFAFWWFDLHPPQILMGDTGSMFLGFMLAILAIFSGGKIATAFLVMGFPLLDFAWVILRRFWKGRSLFRGDFGHFHHRLLRAGFTERQSAFLIYAMCILFGGTALFLGSSQKLVAIGVMVVLMGLLGTFVVLRGRGKGA